MGTFRPGRRSQSFTWTLTAPIRSAASIVSTNPPDVRPTRRNTLVRFLMFGGLQSLDDLANGRFTDLSSGMDSAATTYRRAASFKSTGSESGWGRSVLTRYRRPKYP